VSSANSLVLGASLVTLMLAAVLAALIPAMRAAAIEPIEALRNQ
jgi:ABC-type lipoprotein release transport system permease subunit